MNHADGGGQGLGTGERAHRPAELAARADHIDADGVQHHRDVEIGVDGHEDLGAVAVAATADEDAAQRGEAGDERHDELAAEHVRTPRSRA
jgi:hypothetical protein